MGGDARHEFVGAEGQLVRPRRHAQLRHRSLNRISTWRRHHCAKADPSSTRIIAAAAVTGLVIEAMRKIVSRRIGVAWARSCTPATSTCTKFARATSAATAPAISPLPTWKRRTWLMDVLAGWPLC
jgi:hypothetical protein